MFSLFLNLFFLLGVTRVKKRKRIRSPEAEGEVGKIIVDATIRANFGISTRGVSRFFTTQISREWDSIQPNLQVALYNLMVFPSSFSLEAASTVLKFLTEANTNAVQTAALAATNMIHIDPTTGRCEINERVCFSFRNWMLCNCFASPMETAQAD